MTQVKDKVNNYIYILDGKIYVNLTNACTNNCQFCIRTQKDDVKGTNMWLDKRPYFNEIVDQLDANEELIKNGVTFCGYGEPLMEVDYVIAVAKYIKQKYPDAKIKINTNGHANAVHNKDVTRYFPGLIDEVSISLNAQNEELYKTLSQPKIDNAYDEMLDFARKTIEKGIKTTLTVVTHFKDYDVDVEECKKIAESLGADFREREWIENGY